MSLYTRLIGSSGAKLPVHQFMAALGEYERGKLTAPQVYAAFNLDAGEQAEINTLVSKIVTPLESISMGGYVLMTNVGATYDGTSVSAGGGFAPVELAGITQYEFRVGMNRNASVGTVSFQLWNDTDAAEVAVLNDTTGAGNKFLVTLSALFSPPLNPGVKVLRVRTKSTTATDDPIYLGASLLIRRVGKMTAEVLHELLLLAEIGLPPVENEANLKTRLGV